MKKIAITIGEPGGIGPEIIVKALFCAEIRKFCTPIVIGDIDTIKKAVRLTGLSLEVTPLLKISDSKPKAGKIEVLGIKSSQPFKKCAPSSGAGTAVVSYIKKAVELALKKDVHAIVTAPVSKESLKLAGCSWPGHTELLAELTGTKDFSMMFAGEKLKIILATIHVPLKDMPRLLNKKLVLKTIIHAKKGMDLLGIKKPKIAVAGLNPHAGEAGILGDEEKNQLFLLSRKRLKKALKYQDLIRLMSYFTRHTKGILILSCACIMIRD